MKDQQKYIGLYKYIHVLFHLFRDEVSIVIDCYYDVLSNIKRVAEIFDRFLVQKIGEYPEELFSNYSLYYDTIRNMS